MITITAIKWAPPPVQGLVRDLRLRWALEEAGLPYRVKLFDLGEIKKDAYRHELQPFGQVPALEDGGIIMFESGAILLHIAAKNDVLLPADPAERARATTWLFAALNTIEPVLQPFCFLDLFYPNEEWVRLYRPEGDRRAKTRLTELSGYLGDDKYLEGRFTVGDLMMATVLRMTRDTDILAGYPNLAAYRARCEARPAFQRALTGQMSDFEANAPGKK